MSKTLSKHPLVEYCEPAGDDCYPYKWYIQLIDGYRVQGDDTHGKNLETVADFRQLTIERCPFDCHCGNGCI